jgi:prevent-host-death family protein
MVTMTSAEAQNNFGRLLDTAQNKQISITRHGRIAAVLIPPQDADDLNELRRRRKEVVQGFKEWRERARLTTTPEMAAAAAKLTDEEINRMVHELRG